MCALGIKIMINLDLTTLFSVVLMISSIIIVIFSPLDTKDKPLSAKEKEKYSIISSFIILAYVIGILILAKIGIMKMCYGIMVAIVLESILLLIGFIQQKSITKKTKCERKYL